MASKNQNERMASSGDVKKSGYLKKLKTMKKKFFVLRAESNSGPSCLEYYDSEKKFKASYPPKRSITLKTCFNINRKLDTKQKFVIALYTKDDSFAISLDNEAELDEWLTALLQLQHGEEYLGTSQVPKPNFEHVWQVVVKNRGLGTSKGILGPYRLCLTERTLRLVPMPSKLDSPNPPGIYDFPLVNIRRCANSEIFFFMEVGRSSVTGAGELWMVTDDMLIAQNMHETILNAMKSNCRSEVVPRQRSHSNEASQPISVHTRRQTQANPIPAYVASRERADSMPTRVRTISDGPMDASGLKSIHVMGNQYRPSSMIANTLPSSPPYGSMTRSHENYALDSGESSMSIDDCDGSQPDIPQQKYSEDGHMEPTTEEDFGREDSCYMAMAPGEVQPTRLLEDAGGYMEMDPSSGGMDTTLTPPPPASDYTSFTSPPSWLALGLRAGAAKAASVAAAAVAPSSSSSSPPPPPPSAHQHQYHHHQHQQHHHSPHSSHSGSDYLDMASPGAASSVGTPDGYMPMSPVGSLYGSSGGAVTASKPTYKLSTTTTAAPADSPNGYVPMAPVKDVKPTVFKGHSPLSDDAYLDMNPASNSKKSSSGENISRRSSGTPSTDICFSEYQLDKVRSYFTPTDEDEPMVRACSIGSRADCERRNELRVATEASRIRAFSVGSKGGGAGTGKLGGAGKMTTAASAAAARKMAAAAAADKDGDRGKKSSSAPMLGTSPSYITAPFLGRKAAQNEDFLEMDFPEGVRGSSSGFWPDGSRKGGRPRVNSRSSHQRPGKLETLKSIGEKSSSKSPPSEGAAEPPWMSPPKDSYADGNYYGAGMDGSLYSGIDAAVPNRQYGKDDYFNQGVRTSRAGSSGSAAAQGDASKKPAAKANREYMNMNMKRGESMDKGGSGSHGAEKADAGNRKCSLPVSIQGKSRSSPVDPALSAGGEYISINYGRIHPATTQQQRFVVPQPAPVMVAARMSVNPAYTSVRFPTAGAAAATADSEATSSAASASAMAAPRQLVPSLVVPGDGGKPDAKAVPEYVNLNYNRRSNSGSHGGAAAATVAASATSTTGMTSMTRAPQLSMSKLGDYAIMSPGKSSGGGVASSQPSASSAFACSPIAAAPTASKPTAGSVNANAPPSTESARGCAPESSSAASPLSSSTAIETPKTAVLSTKVTSSTTTPKVSPSTPKVLSQKVSLSTSTPKVSLSSPTVSISSLAVTPQPGSGGRMSPTIADSNGNYGEIPGATPAAGPEAGVATTLLPASSPVSESHSGTVTPQQQHPRASRPSSVSSERELNYASLDMAVDDGERSPRTPRTSKSASLTGSSSAEEAGSALSYAKIDFTKSESLLYAAATASASAVRENRV